MLVDLAVFEACHTNVVGEADESVELIAVEWAILGMDCTADSGFKFGEVVLEQSLTGCLADGSLDLFAVLWIAA